jgi:hypothetical protein
LAQAHGALSNGRRGAAALHERIQVPMLDSQRSRHDFGGAGHRAWHIGM